MCMVNHSLLWFTAGPLCQCLVQFLLHLDMDRPIHSWSTMVYHGIYSIVYKGSILVVLLLPSLFRMQKMIHLLVANVLELGPRKKACVFLTRFKIVLNSFFS